MIEHDKLNGLIQTGVMSLSAFLLSPIRATLFNREISHRAVALSRSTGMDEGAIRTILAETAVLGETDEPTHIQIERIERSGFSAEDLEFFPSIEDGIEALGKSAATELLQRHLQELVIAWRVSEFFNNSFFPVFISTEWASIVGVELAFLREQKSKLMATGTPTRFPPLSSLLRFVPRVSLIQLDDLKAIAGELKGNSQEQVLQGYSLSEPLLGSDLSGLLPEFRKRLVNLQIDSFELIAQTMVKQNFEGLPLFAAHIVSEYLKNWGDFEDFASIESFCLVPLAEEDEITTVQDGDLENVVTLPLLLQDLLDAMTFPAFEFQHKGFAKIRQVSQQRITRTKFDFPLVAFDFWADVKSHASDFFAQTQSIYQVIREFSSFSDEFKFKCLNELRDLLHADKTKDTKRFVIGPSVISDFKTDDLSIEGREILKALEQVSDEKFQVKNSEYIFEKEFTLLRWRDYQWEFKSWEGPILKALYLAHKNGTLDVSSHAVHTLATELHYREAGKSQEKKYMFRHVLQNHELNYKFIVSSPNRGHYRLDPSWTPDSSRTKETAQDRKKRLAKRDSL